MIDKLCLLILGAVLCGLLSCSNASPRIEIPDDPEMTFIDLTNNQSVNGELPLKVEVEGMESVRGVEFFLNEVSVYTDILPPFEVLLETYLLEDGPITVRAMAVDFNEETIETSLELIIDNSAPVVHLLSPPDGSTIFLDHDTFEFCFLLEDVSGLSGLSMTINGIFQELAATIGESCHTINWGDFVDFNEDAPYYIRVLVEAQDLLGQNTEIGKVFNFTLNNRRAWFFQTTDKIWASPVFSSSRNVLYVISNDAVLYALDYQGTELWRYHLEGTTSYCTPAFDLQGNLIVTSGRFVQSLTPEGGVNWTFDAGGLIGSSPSVGPEGNIYVGLWDYVESFGYGVVAVDSEGNKLWDFSAENSVVSAPVVDEQGIVYFGAYDNNIYAVDSSGASVWTFPTGGQIWSTPVLARNGDILVGSNDEFFYRIQRNGQERWRFRTRSEDWGSATEGRDGTVYIGSVDGILRALETGPEGVSERWQYTFFGLSQSSPVAGDDDLIYIGVPDGNLYVMNSAGGFEWSHEVDAPIQSTPAISPDGSLVVFGSDGQRLYGVYTGAARH